jgi:hypothetical protein
MKQLDAFPETRRVESFHGLVSVPYNPKSETSREAAKILQKTPNPETQTGKIYEILKERGDFGLTSSEAEVIHHIRSASACRVFNTLLRLRLAVKTDRTRKSKIDDRVNNAVWVAVEY